MDLAVFWFFGLGALLTVYAVLDGFDLGVGTLHFVARDDHERRLVLNSIGPLWDGNEVWLVTFGGALFAGYPEAYATLLSSLYLPFVFLLVFLIGRAVAIELRSKRPEKLWRAYWDFSFAAASSLTTFAFGLFAGTLLEGLPLDEHGQVARSIVLPSPYAVSIGVFAVVTSAMHAAAFLRLKLEGELVARMTRALCATFAAFVVAYAAVTIATLVRLPHVLRNFEAYPALWALVALHALAIADVPRAIVKERPREAFAATSLVVAGLCFLFGMAMFPYLAYSSAGPPDDGLDVWEASSSETTLGIMLRIAVIGLPLVVTYTAIVYWIFRGKVKLGKFSY